MLSFDATAAMVPPVDANASAVTASLAWTVFTMKLQATTPALRPPPGAVHSCGSSAPAPLRVASANDAPSL